MKITFWQHLSDKDFFMIKRRRGRLNEAELSNLQLKIYFMWGLKMLIITKCLLWRAINVRPYLENSIKTCIRKNYFLRKCNSYSNTGRFVNSYSYVSMQLYYIYQIYVTEYFPSYFSANWFRRRFYYTLKQSHKEYQWSYLKKDSISSKK